MRHSLCQIHTSGQHPRTLICLYKGCPQSYTFCCALCKKEKHQQHEARVASLSDFYKNLNALRGYLNKKLKINAHNSEAEKILDKLKIIRGFRLEIASMEAKILETAIGLGKLHAESISHQCGIMSQIEYLNLNRNEEDAESKIKQLGNALQYNFTKMRMEVSEAKNRKVKYAKDKILSQTEEYCVQLKQYMVKLVEGAIHSSEEAAQQGAYSIQEFKGYLQSSISSLQSYIKQSSHQLRSLQSKLSNLEEQFEQPFSLAEFQSQSQKIDVVTNQENQQQMQQFTKDITQLEVRRSSMSTVNYVDVVQQDDRSVACSIDFSRIDNDGMNGFSLREKFMNIKGRIKGLETENEALLKAKKELELELTNVNNKLSSLIQQISEQKLGIGEVPSNKKVNKKLRLRSFQGMTINPSPNRYKVEFEQVLGLYNQVVAEHIKLKQKSYSSQIELDSLEKQNQKLRKKAVTLDKQLNAVKKDIPNKDKEILSLKERISESEKKIKQLEEREKSGQVQKNSQLQELNEKIRIQSEQLQQLSERIQNLKKENEQQIAKASELRDENTSLREQNAKLNTQAQSLTQEDSSSQKYSGQLDVLEKENHTLKQSLSIVQQTLEKLSSEHQSSLEALQKKQQSIESLQSIVKSANQCSSEFESLIEILQREKKQLQDHNESLRTQSLKESENAKTLEKEFTLKEEILKGELATCLLKIKEFKEVNINMDAESKALNQKIQQQQEKHRTQKQQLLARVNQCKEKQEQINREKHEKEMQTLNLKSLLEEEYAKIAKKDEEIKYKLQSCEALRLEHNLQMKLVKAEKESVEAKLHQTMFQLSALKHDDQDKSTKISDLMGRLKAFQKQSQTCKDISDTSKIRNQTLLLQVKNYQNELGEERVKNQKLGYYIKELEEKIKNVEQKIDKGNKFRGKWGEAEGILGLLKDDVGHLSDKLKDKQLIEKIYIKQLDVKKQQILRLTRQNQSLRGSSVRKDDRQALKLEKQKENKKMKKFLSFGEY